MTVAGAGKAVVAAWETARATTEDPHALTTASPTMTAVLDNLTQHPKDAAAVTAVAAEWAAHVDYRDRPELAGRAECLYVAAPALVAALGRLTTTINVQEKS